jgi:hypothetical protein
MDGISAAPPACRRGWLWAAAGILLAGLGCQPSPPTVNAPGATPLPAVRAAAGESTARAAPAIELIDVTSDSRIAFRHTDGSFGQYYVVEAMGAGLATFDFDNDGLLDIYFLNGVPLRGAPPDAPPGGNALYRNLGNLQFEDVTAKAGVGQAGYGLGVAAADFDNDGHQDLYVSNFGPKVLYRNRGDGTFADVTREAGVADGDQVGAGVCFLDADNDGRLDLYVANYLSFDYATHVPSFQLGIPIYAPPQSFAPLQHSLYRNLGNGRFEDISRSSGIADRPGTGMGVVAADYDDDGDTDIFCANDIMPNFCFQNDGTGKFSEVALTAGVAYNGEGMVLGNMGVDCADFDGDQRLDFFVTTYQQQLPVLFRNRGGGLFEDVTAKAANTQGSYNNSKWGCGFADFDNDGDKDIFLGLGHLQVNIEQYDNTSSYAARPMLLRNDGQGKLADVSDHSGSGLKLECVARGVALDDLDNDGRIDVVLVNSRRAPLVLRNATQNANHWLALQLRGVRANRDAVGARVRVTAGDLVQIDEVHSGRGYQSHFGSRLHFGLGRRSSIDRIDVRWPGGGEETWRDLAVDQILTLTEGTGNSK